MKAAIHFTFVLRQQNKVAEYFLAVDDYEIGRFTPKNFERLDRSID